MYIHLRLRVRYAFQLEWIEVQLNNNKMFRDLELSELT